MKPLLVALGLLLCSATALGADMPNRADNFFKSDKVTLQKVNFKNQYNMKVRWNHEYLTFRPH